MGLTLNDGYNLVSYKVNLLLGGETSDSESDGRVSHVVLCSESSEDVRWLERGGGAGGSGGEGNVLHGHEHRLSLDVRERQVEAT
jgi:hypothetical protein